ncbi:rhodanese-like domain-containing protein [Chitinophaga arvensicola]|uniref:Rhodanese-related sulfurtransferase n=1 Tax=Chitinophaga arvensicola TaxID=29529 RepID=A0A1I0QVC8_9BACT|nr:rhodanese-like domain-containing protein [Chitinophaga arvensicola]SEW30958.1 Rhodanese-related sulfurtransferase [Chitinophaga arvensicola]
MGRFLLAVLLLCSGIAAMAQQKVDAGEFDKDIKQKDAQVFDVRTTGEFNTGHLPNALQADYTKKEEFKDRVQYLDKHRTVYIYCLSGGRSTAAAKWMRENGFNDVVELEGGINAWKQAGKPLDGEASKQPELSVADYNKAVKVKGYVLTDVGATWCPPCKQMEPVLVQFFQKHSQVKKVMVDGGKDEQVMKSVNATKLPTFIVYKDGKEIARKEGVMELKELEKLVGL